MHMSKCDLQWLINALEKYIGTSAYQVNINAQQDIF